MRVSLKFNPMANTTESSIVDWTAVDLAGRFGAVPLARVRLEPRPGSAVVADVAEIHDRERRLFELVDGVLLEKAMGTYESFLAGLLVRWIGNFVDERQLGIVLPPDGILQLAPGLVRIPDVSYIARDRLPDGKIPRTPIASLVPDLAVEILSRGNTAEEMQEKLRDYLSAGVRLIWYVDHENRQVTVYQGDQETIVDETGTLSGEDVLPGFSLPVADIFAQQ